MQTPSSHTNQQMASPWRRRLSSQVWKGSGFLGTAVFLSLGINVVSTWLTSSKGIFPSDSPLAGFFTQWPLVLSIGCCLLLIAIIAKILSRESAPSPASSITTERMQQNRKRMLQRLRQSYSDLNAQSLLGSTRLELGLAHYPDGVQNTTNLLLRHVNQPERMLLPNTTIVEVYEQATHELLILGDPGSGKSTILYQLGLHLVQQSEQDEATPLPILLSLSSWAIKRRPLEEWIGEQLSSSLYKVPRRVGQQWIQREQILPLLDGLDEMEASARTACIAAINKYHQEHLQPLVVCSRSAEYKTAAIDERLALQNAVVIQPLTDQQINDTVIQGGKSLAALRSELKKNRALHDLAKSPLLLSILVLTYRDTTMRALSRKRTALQKQIFTAYIERMQSKGDTRRYPPSETIAWLGRLARQMREHNQATLFLEQLQPDWLPKKQRFFYQSCVVLTIMLILVLFEALTWVLIFVPAGFLLKGSAVSLGGLSEAFSGILPQGLWLGLVLGMYVRSPTIRPSELLTWSWADIRPRLFTGLAIGLSAGGALIIFKSLGIKIAGKRLTKHLSLSPNEGIRRSAKSGILMAFPLGLLLGVFYGLFTNLVMDTTFRLHAGPFGALLFELGEGLLYTLIMGLALALVFGLDAFIQHYILRFWLWHTHLFPLKAVPFLEDATTRALLQRVGGGYRFAHRLLLDYFADLSTESDFSLLSPPPPGQANRNDSPSENPSSSEKMIGSGK